MNRTQKFWNAVFIVNLLALSTSAIAYEAPKAKALTATVGTSHAGSLWHDRGDMKSLNLLYGSGGKQHQPSGKFTFVKEAKEGTSPKFDIVDGKGVHWKVKLGEEAKPETAATRLVWAAGYAVDEDYYLPELQVDKMPRLRRGHKLVSASGVIQGARLERKEKDQKKAGTWSWYKNPFVGTRELNGLKVVMALLNNWDLKEENNAIYEEKGEQPQYLVTDLGATFGKTGNTIVRSKSNLLEYRYSKFIQKVHSEHVDFHFNSRPFFLTVFHLPNYVKRTKMQGIVKHIPLTHAKWMGELLGQLSAEQIRDCFRAAGYSPNEVDGFTAVVRERIAELKKL